VESKGLTEVYVAIRDSPRAIWGLEQVPCRHSARTLTMRFRSRGQHNLDRLALEINGHTIRAGVSS